MATNGLPLGQEVRPPEYAGGNGEPLATHRFLYLLLRENQLTQVGQFSQLHLWI